MKVRLNINDYEVLKLIKIFEDFFKLKPEPTSLTLRSYMTGAWFLTISEILKYRDPPLYLFSIGSNTVLLDNPKLYATNPKLRIVIDRYGKLIKENKNFYILMDDKPALIITTNAGKRIYENIILERKNKEIAVFDEIKLSKLLDYLYDKYKIRKMLVEGGGTLIYHFFKDKLVDEVRLLLIPFISGDREAVSLANGDKGLFPNIKIIIKH